MRLVLRYMKPYWKLATVTVLLSFVESLATLLVPTFVAKLINEGAVGRSFRAMVSTCVNMAAVALLASACAITGGWCVAKLSSHVAKDLRDAVYEKSLDLSMFDFRSFGTASMTTRTPTFLSGRCRRNMKPCSTTRRRTFPSANASCLRSRACSSPIRPC